MKSIFLTFLAVAISAFSFAQINEGSVTFSIDLSSDDPQMQSQFAMFQGSNMKMYFTPKNSRVDLSFGMMMNIITKTDIVANEAILLMSGMVGDKAVKMSEEDMKKSEGDTPNVDVEKTTETKDILGYKCNKYIITTDEGVVMSYWTTNEITAVKKNNKYMYESVDGFPMEFETENGGVKMVFKATEVAKSLKGTNTKELFDMTIPEKYELMTAEQLEGMGM